MRVDGVGRSWRRTAVSLTVVRPDRKRYPCPAAPTGAGRGKPAAGVADGRPLVAQPVDFAGDPHLRDVDPVDTGTPTDATQLIATDPRSGAGAIHRLLRQQEEPPRRSDICAEDWPVHASSVWRRWPPAAFGPPSKMSAPAVSRVKDAQIGLSGDWDAVDAACRDAPRRVRPPAARGRAEPPRCRRRGPWSRASRSRRSGRWPWRCLRARARRRRRWPPARPSRSPASSSAPVHRRRDPRPPRSRPGQSRPRATSRVEHLAPRADAHPLGGHQPDERRQRIAPARARPRGPRRRGGAPSARRRSSWRAPAPAAAGSAPAASAASR